MWSNSRFLIAPRLTLLTALSLLIGSLMIFGSAAADQLPTLEQSEEAAQRQELERISKEDPDKATQEKARQMLKALDEPRTSTVGRELRSRRERGNNKRIVNGIFTIRHSAVAAVLKGRESSTATAHCTGTLIGCDKILTAAHCIDDLPDPTAYLAYFQNLGFVKINDITWPKDYDFPYADLAILTLAKPIEGIAPVSLNTAASPLKGKIATIVGYGRTGGSRNDYGIKRDGSVKFGECERRYAGQKLLCWRFDAEINTTPGDSNTCNADSGGGVFMVDKVGLRTEQRVVGVVSGGRDIQGCVKDDNSFNTDVFLWRDWLKQSTQGTLSDQTCGNGGRVDDPENLRSNLEELDDAKPEATIPVDVPEGTASLRVAMNGEDAGKGDNDFDLLVFNGTDTAVDKPACVDDGPGQFAFCEISNPGSGPWKVILRRKKGEGKAQVSVTLVKDQGSQSSKD